MKIAAIVALSLLLIILGVRIFSLVSEERQLSANFSDVEARLQKAKADAMNVQSESQYLSDPANLEKELRARFNYKKPGESMIVIVPSSTVATSTAGAATTAPGN